MSSSELDTDDILSIAVAVDDKQRKKRSKWSKSWLLKRNEFSHSNLLQELRLNEPQDWFNYLRMNEETFLELLSMVTPLIEKKDTTLRNAITPHQRLAATLRFLASGKSYEDLKFSTCISPQALGHIIPETCDAIYRVLKSKYLKVRIITYVFHSDVLIPTAVAKPIQISLYSNVSIPKPKNYKVLILCDKEASANVIQS